MKTWLPAAIIISFAIVFHALFPRYEWRDVRGVPIVRIDKWTGQQELGEYVAGNWIKKTPAPNKKDAIEQLRDLVNEK